MGDGKKLKEFIDSKGTNVRKVAKERVIKKQMKKSGTL